MPAICEKVVYISNTHQRSYTFRYFLGSVTRVLTMLGTTLAIAFSKAKPNFINSFYEVSQMNKDKLIEIHADIIRSAILKIASDNPDWFYTEIWLKDLLYLMPRNYKPSESLKADSVVYEQDLDMWRN